MLLPYNTALHFSSNYKKRMPDFEASRSSNLSAIIQDEIKREGPISFEDFMGLALYHPTLGYYCSESFELGEKGDFTTAPELTPLFAKCFAKQFQQLAACLPDADILEIGAGSGRFAGDILAELNRLNCLPQHYYISEISPSLRQQQKLYLENHYPQFLQHVIWLDQLPDTFRGVIIANEVLDALPFNTFIIENNQIKERRVDNTNGQFEWINVPAAGELNTAVTQLQNELGLAEGYASEINLQYSPFIKSLTDMLVEGVILFIDYGYGQREYYHPQRHQGTLTCFHQHRKHNNPLVGVGLQDITAHVDFTRVIECAAEAGMDLLGFTSQSSFLLGCGLLDIATEEEKGLNESELFKLHQAIKVLTMPTEMGETIKIMGLGKNVDLPALIGFSLQDRRRDL